MLVEIRQPDPSRARECSACGAAGAASCDCGAPLVVPALERAKTALLANPQLSNRAVAAKSGISEPTVRRARATASDDAVEKRVGLDGKARRLPQPAVPEPKTPAIKPTTSPAMQEKLARHGWYQRAELAAQEARYAATETCPRNAKMKRLAKDVIKAWTDVLNHIGDIE
ncbi:MAG: winged helix-turn-helix domain-containing protein [Nocardiaceae bacterium]|nr:winged helix-turn-helix domain-containing protein [Nocardiaceae bacterium]